MNLELVILDGPEAGRRIAVPSGPVTLGRAPAAAMAFPDDGFISSVHLSMQSEGDGVRITDLRSTNGTFLNNERVSSALAGLGDVIQIGTMTMQVARAQSANPAPVYSAPVAAATPTYSSAQPKDLPRMDVPAPPPMPAAIAATTTIPRIAVDGSERFRRHDQPQAEPESPAATLRNKLQGVSAPIFLMVNAAVDESLTARLAMADIDLSRHTLWKEGESPAPARWAPFLVPAKAEAPLLGVLLDNGWGKSWVSVFTSAASFEDLREHFTKFLKVQMEGTGGIYFRFYDPQVLRHFLSSGSAAEVAMFFGPVQEWFLEGEGKASILHASHSESGLSVNALPLSGS